MRQTAMIRRWEISSTRQKPERVTVRADGGSTAEATRFSRPPTFRILTFTPYLCADASPSVPQPTALWAGGRGVPAPCRLDSLGFFSIRGFEAEEKNVE